MSNCNVLTKFRCQKIEEGTTLYMIMNVKYQTPSKQTIENFSLL